MQDLKIYFINDFQSSYFEAHLEGALIGMDAIELKKWLLEAFEVYGKDLHLHIGHVKQMDLGGLNTLVGTYLLFLRNRCNMKLLIPKGGSIHEVIALSKMEDILPIETIKSA